MTGTTSEEWRKQYAGKPIRLLVTCRLGSAEPWTLLYEVHAELEKRAAIRVVG
jgi:hypothetical protein